MMRNILLSICLLLSAWAMVPAMAEEVPTTQPRGILSPGQSQADLRAYLLDRAPWFIAPSDSTRWEERADLLRRRVLDEVVCRGVPADWLAGPVHVVWGDTLPGEGYVIRKLRLEAVPHLWVGALLYEPTDMIGKRPAVLNLNGHVGEPGMTIEYKQIRCINLAKRGMLALSVEFIGMGQMRTPAYAHNDGAYLDLCGRASVSVFYQCLKRGLDILCAHKAADPDRIAVTGLSGGGWQTIVISSLDTRVKLAAPNAGYIGIKSRILHRRDIGDLEQNAADLVSVADYVHLTAMLYPRPALLIYNEKDDCCFRAEQAWYSVYQPVAPLYEQAGLSEKFAFHVNHDPGTHNYLLDNREAFYRFLNRHFLPEAERCDKEIPADDEVRTPEELAIDYPTDNASFHSLAADAMRSLPGDKKPTSDAAAVEQWRKRTRTRLKKIVRPDPELAVVERPADSPNVSSPVGDVPGHGYHLRLGGLWTLPAVKYECPGAAPAGTALILTDKGRSLERDVVQQAIERKRRAVVVDLLFTGECKPVEGSNGQWGMMISALGRRPLGVQVAQLDAVIDRIKREHAGEPLRLVACGRVPGLAALTWAALNPGGVDAIQLRGMVRSLKDLLAKKVRYEQEPSLFCFGLLEVADMPELIDLALPTKVELIAADDGS